MTTNIVFTRYLYLKSGVLESLETSILKNDFHESLFWSYEIYYSGFEKEIFDFLFEIIQRYYKNFPKLTVFLKKKLREWENEKQDDILGTIVKNLCLRNHLFIEGKGKQFYVIINPQDVENQKTKTIKPLWKTLSQVCLYDGFKKNHDSLLTIFINDWLFYACYSPIWKTRLLQYNGTIDIHTKLISFVNDDDLENFYHEYGYEPEEQQIIIQKRCIFDL